MLLANFWISKLNYELVWGGLLKLIMISEHTLYSKLQLCAQNTWKKINFAMLSVSSPRSHTEATISTLSSIMRKWVQYGC